MFFGLEILLLCLYIRIIASFAIRRVDEASIERVCSVLSATLSPVAGILALSCQASAIVVGSECYHVCWSYVEWCHYCSSDAVQS